MISERLVLLAVKHFKQGRGGVASHIGAQLVYFVKQHYGIHTARLSQRGDDSSGHSRHICFSVAAYFGFVPDAAQRDTDKFSVHCSCHGSSQRGLSHSGRADKTYYLIAELGI